MDETIHVAYCLNDGFAIPTCVSMASLLANTKSSVCFHVVSNRLSDENKGKLAQLGERFPHGRWIFHDLEIGQYKDRFVLQKNIHVTVEVYYRLFLHEVITGVDRLIYLDGDIIVCGDIKELWCENLCGKTLGAVKDILLRPTQELNKLLEFDVEKCYFNAGILLIDLAKYSKLIDLNTIFDVTEALYAKFLESGMTWYADQDLLNHIVCCVGDLTLLHARYNLQRNDFDQYASWNAYAQNCSTLSEWTEANAYPIIIHYTGAYKPWQLRNKFRYSDKYDLYFAYKALTPFNDDNDIKRLEEYEKKRKLTHEEALLPGTVYTSMFWPDMFTTLAGKVKERINGRKLVFWGTGNHTKHIISIFALNGLFPAKLVDGLERKQGCDVFEYRVESPEQLNGKASEYYVVLSIETKKGKDTVVSLLKEYNYSENDYIFAYAEAFEREECPLL